MSGTNAIHGIVILGGFIALATAHGRHARQGPGLHRDRLRHDQRGRRLPGHRPDARDVQAAARSPSASRKPEARDREAVTSRRSPRSSRTRTSSRLLHRRRRSCSSSACGSCRTRRPRARGNLVAAVGMAIAIVATLLKDEITDYALIAARRRDRHDHRHPLGALGEDDRDAADGGAVQRRRRRRGRADRVGRVPPLPADAARRATRAQELVATDVMIFLMFSTIVGAISFWGSNIAFGKLQELISGQADPGAGPAGDQRADPARDPGRIGLPRRRRPGRQRGRSSSPSWSWRRCSAC